MNWIKEHIIEAIGLLIALLTYFEVGPNELVNALSGINFVFYIIAGALIGWGACRTFHGIRFKRKRISRREAREREEQFKADFGKCPYWIKVFLKTVLDKEEVFARAGDFNFENYAQFILQFVDYKTVGRDEWQFGMDEETRRYFKKNGQLLADVKDEDIHRHARKTEGMRFITSFSQEFDWWYYSDEDYIEPTKLDHSNPLGMFG